MAPDLNDTVVASLPKWKLRSGRGAAHDAWKDAFSSALLDHYGIEDHRLSQQAPNRSAPEAERQRYDEEDAIIMKLAKGSIDISGISLPARSRMTPARASCIT